ncbi:MAG TPA: serine/threonine-protein kinase [Polyangiales bacterium]|nr:serine/threonine-protein kinase [Polyangiales bacterium]
MRDGEVIDDHFRLVRQLGQGGMGTVWAAEDLRLGRPVAIKFLSSDFLNDAQARQRFAREPKLASKIRSPHVVQVFAQGTTADGVPYLVMELLEGQDLASRIAAGPCSLVEAGSIVEQIVRALGRAHREHLVHRDIKPHNVFLLPEDDGQVFVKLLDFGIAKDVGTRVSTLTLTGEVVGSALYVSPEQLHDPQSVGIETDIWSLGVVIYEMLTGRVPFEGRNLPELFMRIVEGRYVPATQLGVALPLALDAFLAQALVVDRTKRFQSVDELGAAFARIVRANSSGLLRKSDLGLPRAEEPETERVPKPWPASRWIAAAVGTAGALALLGALLGRAGRETSQQPALRAVPQAPGVLRPSAPQPASQQPSAAGALPEPPRKAQPAAAAQPLVDRPARKKKITAAPSGDAPVPPKNPSPAQQNYGF